MTFDWVKERAACSAAQMFERLKADIAEDVKTRQELIKPHPEFGAAYGFKMTESYDTIRVFRQGNREYYSLVTITLGKEVITVHKETEQITLNATVTLNNEGVCVFKVKGDELQPWQFRKMILEEVFFHGL